ncbi:YvrJ family protein [Clostridium sp. Sa3CUN1]|uniref:YvrJ family protein n=1 Tax=Clostridium gallinarum TaxID=2762246 RepID=A0ABR8Q0F6_9CLOT|nr:YvrJ family protein [Clostridium gallinarum]MBD7913901.1 YvrJ family protein [Clostridium gallinarum]
MNELVDLISNIGFPIAISLYLLIRIEGKLENLTNSINNLSQTINTIK